MTSDILDTLAEHRRKAVFFVVGDKIAGREYLLERLVADGHEVGNHTMTHPRLTDLSHSRIVRELQGCSKSIAAVTGTKPTLFRPPFAATDMRVADVVREMGMTMYAESSVGDYDLELDQIVEACRGRDFIGLHELAATSAALAEILQVAA